jgi:hypothetical protein
LTERDTPSSRWRVGLALLTVAYFSTRLINLTVLPIFLDEALHVEFGRRPHPFLSLARTGKWMSARIIGLFAELPIDPLVAVRLVAVLSGFVALSLIIKSGASLNSRKAGYAAALLYVISPYSLFYDRLALADAFLPATTAATIWLSVSQTRKPTWQTGLALTVLLSTAGLLKYSALVLVLIPLLAVLVLTPPVNWRRGLLYAGPPLLFVSALAVIWHWLGLTPLEIAVRTEATSLQAVWLLGSQNFGVLYVLFSDMLTPPLLWVFLASLAWALFYRRRRQEWFLVLVLGVLLLPYMVFARIWYPPYLVGSLIPLYLLVARFCLEVHGTWAARGCSLLRGWRGAGCGALLVLPMLLQDARILSNPERAHLPPMMRESYIADWTSGYGIREAAHFLEREAGKYPGGVNVIRMGLPDQPLVGLNVYLRSSPDIRIFTLPVSIERSLDDVIRILATGKTTFFIFDGTLNYAENSLAVRRMNDEFSTREIWNHPKPGGRAGFRIWEIQDATWKMVGAR